jgi:translocation protein SEC66
VNFPENGILVSASSIPGCARRRSPRIRSHLPKTRRRYVVALSMDIYESVIYYYVQMAASRQLEPWFPSHPERDVYVSLLQCEPPAHEGLIKAALVRRAVADVHRIFRLREDKVALSNLLQRGSIGDDLWTSFLAAEKELEAEILEVVTEAETFKTGWGNLIFQTAAEIVQNEKLREGMNKVFHSRPQLG